MSTILEMAEVVRAACFSSDIKSGRLLYTKEYTDDVHAVFGTPPETIEGIDSDPRTSGHSCTTASGL